MISSAANAKIKYIKRLHKDSRFRRSEGAFVVEGTRWFRELQDRRLTPRIVLYTEAWAESDGNRELLITGNQADQFLVSDEAIQAASDLKTQPGILCVVEMPTMPLHTSNQLALIIDAMGNPGNMGTMLRTAAAAGVDEILLGPGCVDAFAPKVLRGAMGAHLRLAISHLDWPQIKERTHSMNIVLASAHEGIAHWDLNWQQPIALIVGSEAHGASRQAKMLAQTWVSIPLHAQTESLNAAMAAGIILFEGARQRWCKDAD